MYHRITRKALLTIAAGLFSFFLILRLLLLLTPFKALMKGFMGNYSQYHEWLEEKNKEIHKAQVAERVDTRENRPKATERQKKRSFKEQKEYEQLAIDIDNLEKEKKELTSQLENQTDYQEIDRIGKRLTEIKDLLDEKEMRWLELDEI